MSDSQSAEPRMDRRLIGGLAVAAVATVVVIALVLGTGGGGTPAASLEPGSVATEPPVATVDEVVSDGEARPVRLAELAVDGGGTVASVPVALGDEVAAGAVLVTLDGAALEAELAGAVAGAEASAARTAQAEALVKQAEEQVAVAEANLDGAQAALETARDRNAGEDEATAARNAARAQVRAAKASLTAAREAATAAAADARGADAAVDALEVRKAGLEIVAPFAGTIASLSAMPGQSVSPGQVLVRVADPSAWEFVATDLDESGIARVREGAQAVVTLDGVPGVEIPGTVARIGTFGEARQGGIVYEVVVTPTGQVPDGVRWNMTASIAIKAGE